MDQVYHGESSGGLSAHPIKRKRGRPRKDPSLKRTGTARVPPGFEGVKEHLPQRADRTDGMDSMVGQAVTGVVEASFDAGYLLSVRIGNSNTNLRGVVFKPGHFIPVTAENDVAPHLQMIRRNDVNFPAEKQGWSRRQKLAMVPVKRKYASPKISPSVPPVGVRGTVVPVVLQPVNFPSGVPTPNQMPSDASRMANLMSFGDKDVHMVEPLSMLPPDRSIPVNQIFLGTQQQTSHQVSQGSEQNDSEPFDEVGQVKKGKPTESTDVDNLGSSETSDVQTENGKEAPKSSTEDSGNISKPETDNTNEPMSTESFQTASVSKPFFSYGPGRMTELLQALQENMKENQLQIAEQPPTASIVEFHEAKMPETNTRNEASVP
ncbi:uncharacterized protein LOC105176693 [Sesamum indicum]|uniref:Uncharacterized protein LOC105176693 n=1 Tax=Sesamum indicum TaxID=4182 RepID=A0A6I9USV5_SESIN|nr:uncharacterized protein LOC105176693 [Sesamum indicum]XP_011097884.1 uncharacterized protein LOC105176693 [Sesamum indicum]